MVEAENRAVSMTSDYYNSQDADTFYAEVWGGEDIHVGLYQSANEPIFEASQRTKITMASYLDGLNQNSRVLDMEEQPAIWRNPSVAELLPST